MKCLIIAAGQGTRLRPLAESKPLAQVKGTPLIEHVVRSASAGGASEFVVVVGYEAPRLQDYLGGLADRLGVPILTVDNPDWSRPNGISVLAAAEHLTSEFILLMSDHLFDAAILRRLVAARRPEASLTLATDYRITNPLIDLEDATKVSVQPDGRIVAIGKALPDYDAIDTGIFLATPSLIGAIRASLDKGGAGSLSEGVQALAHAGGAYAFDIEEGWWIDVDDAEALSRAEQSLPRLAP